MKPNDHDTIFFHDNKYTIKDDKDLRKLIYEHPEGIEVGDALLKYSSDKKVSAYLDRM
jgi:hypothetical protein